MGDKIQAEDIEHKEIRCNICGQPIEHIRLDKTADYLYVKKRWNYFSAKDLTVHSFVVCEVCYDKWTESFTIPVEEKEVIEIFDFPDL